MIFTDVEKADREELLLLRADLMQYANGLELQRSAVLSYVSRIEKRLGMKGKQNGSKNSSTKDHAYPSTEGPS